MKQFFKLISFLIVLLISTYIILCIQIPNYNKELINCKSIESIRPGDSLSKVIRVLGSPINYEISLYVPHEFNCIYTDRNIISKRFETKEIFLQDFNSIFQESIKCCAGASIKIKNFTFTYTKRYSIFCHPMLWVHLDKDLKVYSVYAKEYSFFNDKGIYDYSCVWDDVKNENIYSNTSYFHIKSLFESNFN